jgi:hypothetical protein
MSASERGGPSGASGTVSETAPEPAVVAPRPSGEDDDAATQLPETGGPVAEAAVEPTAAAGPGAEAATPADGRPSRLRALAARVRPVAPALALYTAVKAIGFASFIVFIEYAHRKHYVSRSSQHRVPGWLSVLGSWDGSWYQGVAKLGYHPALVYSGLPLKTGQGIEANSAAFFPLYPALIRIVHELTRLSYLKSAVLASILASLVAAAGIYCVGKLLAGNKAALIAVALWAVFPSSGVEWSAYSESALVAAASWCLYFTLRRQWLAGGALAFLAGLSRPTAVAMVGAYMLAALIALIKRRDTDGWVRPLIGMCVAPLGLVGYLLWVGIRMGNLKGYALLDRYAWGQYFDFGKWTARGYIKTAMGQRFWHDSPQEDLIAILLLTALPMLLILLLRTRPPLPVIVFSVLFIGAALTTRQNFGNISRYLLPVFPLLYPVAQGLRRLTWPVLGSCFAIAALASGWYAGYIPFILGVP